MISFVWKLKTNAGGSKKPYNKLVIILLSDRVARSGELSNRLLQDLLLFASLSCKCR